jgi:hypothetical protein
MMEGDVKDEWDRTYNYVLLVIDVGTFLVTNILILKYKSIKTNNNYTVNN